MEEQSSMQSNHRTVTVTVLEARPRVGGRVYSVRSFLHGQVAEGGGEFIEEGHTSMLVFAREFNLS
jgi:monoamine oxidase